MHIFLKLKWYLERGNNQGRTKLRAKLFGPNFKMAPPSLHFVWFSRNFWGLFLHKWKKSLNLKGANKDNSNSCRLLFIYLKGTHLILVYYLKLHQNIFVAMGLKFNIWRPFELCCSGLGPAGPDFWKGFGITLTGGITPKMGV